MKGKIIKGIGGFYYVHVQGEGVFACRARGIFRLEKRRPVVGDEVEITVTDVKDMEGSVQQLFPRRNELIRPAAANVDQALVVFSVARPAPALNLLDRFLISMKTRDIPVIVCFSKTDLAGEEEIQSLTEVYAGCGHEVLTICVKEGLGIDELKKRLDKKTTIAAGPSGVGKSSLTNILQPEAGMETGEVSRKAERGKQTTRHTQLIWLWKDTYFMDTPGFSSLYLPDISREQLAGYYPEFVPFEPECRFLGCAHVSEPDCGVKRAVEEGKISRVRYDNYVTLFRELEQVRRY